MAKTRQTGSSGERLVKVLEALIEAERPLSLPEIGSAVDLPKPTVHRLVTLLEEVGYAMKDPGGRRYVPGPTIHKMARRLIQGRSFSAARHALLERLADSVGEAANLVLLDGSELIYIDRVDTAWPLRLKFDVGTHVPIHCTAAGKLLLALQPKRARDRLIEAISPLLAHTDRSITDQATLEEELKTIRRRRIGTDNQEFLAEMVAVAVPIDIPTGVPIAALSIHAPTARRSLDDLLALVPQLQETAKRISDTVYEPEHD
jgi:IclR family acetate operon transcriptional repressor